PFELAASEEDGRLEKGLRGPTVPTNVEEQGAGENGDREREHGSHRLERGPDRRRRWCNGHASAEAEELKEREEHEEQEGPDGGDGDPAALSVPSNFD